MKYKKLFLGILMTGVALTLTTSCKKDEPTPVIDTVYTTVILNAGQPSDDGSEITEGKNWSAGDKIAIMNIRVKRDITAITYNGSAFTGETADLYSGARLAFFYPYSALNFAHSDTITYQMNMSDQDGTPATLKNYMTAVSDSLKFTDQSVTINKTMTTLQAQGQFKFNYQGNPIPNITRVELFAAEGRIFSQRTFNLRNQSWDDAQSNSIVINNAQGLNGEMVISMLPTESVLIAASVETASGMKYIGKATESSSIESGKKYEFTINCEADNVKAHIGDYYYNDGSFSKELDYGKTAVGIVFALSDKFGGAINNSLDESLHGRVVSFSDLTSQNYRWAYQSTMLFDVDKLTNYPGAGSNSENDSIAYLPYLKGGNENTYYADSCHINLSIDRETGHMKSWPTAGALSSFTGSENTDINDASKTKFPAAFYVHTLVRSGISNKRWYMPAAGELALLYELWRQQVITAATKPGFKDFGEYAYWTSDEGTITTAWAINFFNGMMFRNNKMSSYYVRPCLWF